MKDERKLEIVKNFKEQIYQRYNLNVMSDENLETVIEQMITDQLSAEYITIEERVDIMERVYSSIRGLGVLDAIIKDDDITEVMINGPKDIFIEKAGKLSKLTQTFDDEKQLEDVVQKIVGQAGREVNQANPIVDTRLPDGSRVNVVLPPISLHGAIVTIRKFSKTPMTVQMLLRYGSITPEVAHVLEILVKAKYNIFICGGTGSGKTTFLNAISNYIPHDERVITIEDSAELQIEGIDNLVSLETRNANASGHGAVTIRDLIKSSLRMRPEGIKIKKGKLKRKKKRIPIPHTFLQHILGNLIPFIRCEVVKIIEEADDLLSFFHSILHVESILPINGICTQHSFPE